MAFFLVGEQKTKSDYDYDYEHEEEGNPVTGSRGKRSDVGCT
jgi:hypothetical protein